MKTIGKIIVALIIVYILGLVFFTVFTYPNTYVNNEKVGIRLTDNALESHQANPSILIKGRNNKSDTLTGSDIDYTRILVPGQLIDQNQFIWPIAIFSSHSYDPEYDIWYDKNLFDQFLDNSELGQNMIPPSNAYVDESGGEVFVVEEVEGDTIDKDKAEETIMNSMINGHEEVSLTDEYIEPEIRSNSEEIKNKLELANELKSFKIVFDMGDEKEKIGKDQMLAFYDSAGDKYIPNGDRVYEYVRQLAIEYDTFSEDQEREFTTSKGDSIIVVGGIYGWLMDVEATNELFLNALNEKNDTEIIPIYLMQGLERSKDDIGQTYIEISLDDQHLWFYKDGELVTETPIVSGDPTKDVATSTGVGKIWSKEQDRDLVGIVPQSSQDYSSFVDYWMPINWNNEGIHNSTWRKEYGGNIYIGNGSYGCINLPYEATKEIFDNVEINTPVVVY